MLNDEELKQLREIQEMAMPDTCTVWRKSISSSNGVRIAERDEVETTRCQVLEPTQEPQIRVIAETLGQVIDQVVVLPVDSQAKPGDELEISGRLLVVIAAPYQSYATGKVCYCKEIRR